MFDVAHSPVLSRTQDTLGLILRELGQTNISLYNSWRLNERHYGHLTGMDKNETVVKYGLKMVGNTIQWYLKEVKAYNLRDIGFYFSLLP